MEEFDVVVIGSGSGMIVAANAVAKGLKTALIEMGTLGGTCLNRGCVPSKMLIYPADIATLIFDAKQLGINARIESIDFSEIMGRMRTLVNADVQRQVMAVEADPKITWFKDLGEFIGDYTLGCGDKQVRAERIFIVSGARPSIPPINGLQSVDYLTSDTVLNLTSLPRSMIIIGGGYVAAEYGHFFSSLGTDITIIQRSSSLLPQEEAEISEVVARNMRKRMKVYTSCEAVEVTRSGDMKIVVARSIPGNELKEFPAETILLAAGRVPNSDVLKPEKTGVELDKRRFIRVNEYLETRKKNIYAFGDAIGKHMFKHVANYEAQVAWHNSMHDHKVKVDYSATPHAVFTHPQVAAIGLKEVEARQLGKKILIGRAFYRDTALGAAMMETDGMVKVVVERDSGRILGAHIVGPQASTLIQEIADAMTSGDRTFLPIVRGLHIHPAMSEVVQSAFGNLRE